MSRTRHETDTNHEGPRAASPQPQESKAPLLDRAVSYATDCVLPTRAREFLYRLIDQQLLNPSSVGQFLKQAGPSLSRCTNAESLGHALVEARLLTQYQLDRITAGTTHGLLLGNHRVLDRLGAGAMGIVFLAEHTLMKRRVAVKVLPMDDFCPPALWERFCAEMQVLAALQHPNIVLAFDAGQLAAAGRGLPALLYLVMELVPGGDLDQHVRNHGPVDIVQACEWIRQAACGLQEAHDRHLIHRDIKPSNLLLTAQKQIKVTDFGLVRQFSSRLTAPHHLLGTLGYMAPEQSCDPSLVDGRADIYGLGATLLWLLTGDLPYPPASSPGKEMRALQTGRPRRLRSFRPDAPEELDALIDRMLRLDPAERPAQPLNVMNELLRFTTAESSRVREWESEPPAKPNIGGDSQAYEDTPLSSSGGLPGSLSPAEKRVLIVDDEASARLLVRSTLEHMGLVAGEAADATTALASLQKRRYDLVLLDLNLPDMDGYELCRRIREAPGQPYLKIIVISGRGDQNQLSEALPLGADDYIAKPFGMRQLRARVEHSLGLKAAQDQAQALTRQLILANQQLEASLAARTSDVRQAQDALLFAMAKMAESKDGETSGHLRRLQRYTRSLAERVAEESGWEGLVNSAFLEQLERCVPLHDIGKIGLPEYILLKPGKLTDSERSLMETHTVIGDSILEALGQEYGTSLLFLRMASAIVRHHHERYDGTGYPDRLSEEAIPAAARLVAVADVYDALRRQRSHKSALDHAEAARILLQHSEGQFDPAVLRAFQARQQEFERIYRDIRT
jgi:response regulator RpfG family c-di-GMP phosphodiesterase/serine/threonine protein kinase